MLCAVPDVAPCAPRTHSFDGSTHCWYHVMLTDRCGGMQTACDLELWQEAFRSVEDIQGLMNLSKKTPKPQLMAVYYARLTRIFAVSNSHLYNGYAWCVARSMLFGAIGQRIGQWIGQLCHRKPKAGYWNTKYMKCTFH